MNHRGNRVRRVIRRKGTTDYYMGDGWTQDPQQARNFSDSLEAALTCADQGLENVELALILEGEVPHEVFCTAIR